MSHSWDRTSAEMAETAEHERADLAHTLDQLRENLQPRNMVDEVMSRAGVDPVNMSDQLFRFARANPVAAALIGIGAAMLAGTGRRAATGDRASPRSGYRGLSVDPDERRGASWRERTSALDADFRDADDLPYAARADTMPYPAEPRFAMNTVSVIKHPRSSLSRLIEDQPLVLAALGVAVGAAIGSALPSTSVESNLMGDASEAMRQNANAAARQQLAQLRAAAGETFEQMKATAAEHGATTENLYGLVHDLGDDVRTASNAVGRQDDEFRSRA